MLNYVHVYNATNEQNVSKEVNDAIIALLTETALK